MLSSVLDHKVSTIENSYLIIVVITRGTNCKVIIVTSSASARWHYNLVHAEMEMISEGAAK